LGTLKTTITFNEYKIIITEIFKNLSKIELIKNQEQLVEAKEYIKDSIGNYVNVLPEFIGIEDCCEVIDKINLQKIFPNLVLELSDVSSKWQSTYKANDTILGRTKKFFSNVSKKLSKAKVEIKKNKILDKFDEHDDSALEIDRQITKEKIKSKALKKHLV